MSYNRLLEVLLGFSNVTKLSDFILLGVTRNPSEIKSDNFVTWLQVDLRLLLKQLQVDLRLLLKVDLRLLQVDLGLLPVDLRLLQVDLRLLQVDLRLLQVDLRLLQVDLGLLQVDLRLWQVDTNGCVFCCRHRSLRR